MVSYTEIIKEDVCGFLLRLLDFLLAVLLFGIVADTCYAPGGYCYFGTSPDNMMGDFHSCEYAIFAGVFGAFLDLFLFWMFFLKRWKMTPYVWWPLIELVMSLAWIIFLFGNAANLQTKYKQSCAMFASFGIKCTDSNGQFGAQSAVFVSWYLFITWIMFVYLAFKRWKNRNGPADIKLKEVSTAAPPVDELHLSFVKP